jgi:hypothetical protein
MMVLLLTLLKIKFLEWVLKKIEVENIKKEVEKKEDN